MLAAFSDDFRRAIRALAARHPGLELLVLHGSRALDLATPLSDWDFGYVAGARVELDALIADLVRVLGCDRVDVADLDRASALLRYRGARDGIPLYERSPGAFARFWLDAVRFWCDAAPILQRGYEDTLADLDR